MDRYDVIFVFSSSRLHPYLLNLSKYIAKDYRFGILMHSFDESFSESEATRRLKTKETDVLYLKTCEDFGASILYLKPGNRYSCRLMMLPQGTYKPEFVSLLDANVYRDKTIALQGFAHIKKFFEFYKQLRISKFFLMDKKIFTSIATEEKLDSIASSLSTEECGTPYLKYPIFEQGTLPEIDYLVALPTLIFIKKPQEKAELFRNIYNFISTLGPDEKVVIKLHNVKDGGNQYMGETFLRSRTLADAAQKYLPRYGAGLAAAIYYRKILDMSVSLSSLTPFYNFALEHFLPFVKKGVITGISTVQWHCLYNRIPVYNCDPQPFGYWMPNYDVYKNFYIPFCGGTRTFDAFYFQKIGESTRGSDVIQMIKKEISNT